MLTAGLDLAWYPWLGRKRAAAVKAEVYHCPAPRGPLFAGRLPVVMTVHDLVPFLFPETMTRWSRSYSRATHRRMAAAADRIICPSHDTARDVVERHRRQIDVARSIPPAPPDQERLAKGRQSDLVTVSDVEGHVDELLSGKLAQEHKVVTIIVRSGNDGSRLVCWRHQSSGARLINHSGNGRGRDSRAHEAAAASGRRFVGRTTYAAPSSTPIQNNAVPRR